MAVPLREVPTRIGPVDVWAMTGGQHRREILGGTGLGGFLCLIRIAKKAALAAAAWTTCCALLLLGWQTKTWLAEEIWPTVQLSTIVQNLGIGGGAIYLPASVDEFEESGLTGAISGVPAIVPLLVALAMLIAFYLWLRHAERSLLPRIPRTIRLRIRWLTNLTINPLKADQAPEHPSQRSRPQKHHGDAEYDEGRNKFWRSGLEL